MDRRAQERITKHLDRLRSPGQIDRNLKFELRETHSYDFPADSRSLHRGSDRMGTREPCHRELDFSSRRLFSAKEVLAVPSYEFKVLRRS